MKVVAIATLSLLCAASAPSQTSSSGDTPQFGGTYDGLSAGQRRLIDDWVDRYAKLIQETIVAEEAYNDLPLSVRTTYEAVSHALERTELTDDMGTDFGTALDVVEHIETVRGKVDKARGDRQFRMYARIAKETLDKLEASTQFKRGHDNTVYHKGYPLNYRQQGGVPSVQFSIARSGRRADIDVDYRASGFPKALFNGHLTASNSDVRAGNNHQRHNGRWIGLEDWWRGWFGLPLRSKDHYGDEEDVLDIPDVPRKGGAKPQQAMRDFLTAWLVEGKENEAAAYISRRAVGCDREPGDEDEDYDFGLAPMRMMLEMRAARQSLGDADKLADVSAPVYLVRPGLLSMEHDDADAFSLYRVPERLGEARLCENRDEMGFWPEYKPRDKPRYGKYFGAALHLRAGNYKGAALYLLWAKDEGQWRIVSYHAEPDGTEAPPVPDLRDDTEFEIARVDGPKDLVAATLDFHRSWFVTQNYHQALTYLTDESDRCVDLYLEEGEQRPADPAAYDRRIAVGFDRTVKNLGLRDGTPLEEAIRAIEPADPVVRVVNHEASDYYTILALPNFVAENATCTSRLEDVKFPKMPDEPKYGDYYAGAFRANIPGEPAILYTLWAQRDDVWRVIAWHIEEP